MLTTIPTAACLALAPTLTAAHWAFLLCAMWEHKQGSACCARDEDKRRYVTKSSSGGDSPQVLFTFLRETCFLHKGHLATSSHLSHPQRALPPVISSRAELQAQDTRMGFQASSPSPSRVGRLGLCVPKSSLLQIRTLSEGGSF